MKIKILFLTPTESEKLVMEKDKDVNSAYGTYPPLGLMYIATYLKDQLKDKVDVKIIDCSVGSWSIEKFARIVKDVNPDVVGMTAFTPSIMDIKMSMEKIKEIIPNCITVIGGPHVTTFGKDAINLKCIDYGVMGYGEYSFCKLIDALYFKARLKNVPGLVYRKGKDVIINPMNNDIIKLDDLPIPDRKLVPYHLYRCPVGTKDIMATLVSSRGCPFQCTFCNSPDKKYRARSIENVIKEVKYLQSLGVKEIFFFDDLFNLKNDRVFELCKQLKQNNIKITWAFKSRAENINEELMKAVKAVGCERIHFGLETHTDEGLRKLRKGETIEQMRKAISLCYKYKINSVGSFMINLPGDTKKMILDRFRFANSLKLDYNQYGVFIAYNHTEIFYDGVKKGLWDKDLWLNYIRNPTADFIPPIWDNGIPRKELDRLVKKGLKSFYFRPQYIYQRIRNIHSWDELKKYLSGGLKLLKFKE